MNAKSLKSMADSIHTGTFVPRIRVIVAPDGEYAYTKVVDENAPTLELQVGNSPPKVRRITPVAARVQGST